MRPFDTIKVLVAFVMLFTTVSASHAQTVTTLVNFDGSNGGDPFFMAPLQGFDGRLYGATANGGANTCTLFGSPMSCGVVFNTTNSGKVTVLHSFDGTDGAYPDGTLLQDERGNFYGVTLFGGSNTACALYGANGCGTVFKITPSGVFTSLYSFCSLTNCTDGAGPTGGLVLAADGNLYGATSYGGNYLDCSAYGGCGTIFRITTTGKLTTLYSFAGTDGSFPNGPLVQSNGILYGVASGGGASGDGTVFAMTANGKLSTLHSFSGSDGMNPNPVILGTDGNLYGSAIYGGSNTNSTCGTYGCGTVFKMSRTGKLTMLYSFCSQANCADGFVPLWSLFQAADGDLYGNTSEFNGITIVGAGTIFKITAGGTFTNVYTFSGIDGYFPEGAMMQDTNGTLYGTTAFGGTTGNGNIFSLSEGLHPFVETEPTSGKVGSKVIILGNSLKGTTAVSFNGAPAVFTVVSSTGITTTVPAGATTGTVEVTTTSGTLKSNVVFRVRP